MIKKQLIVYGGIFWLTIFVGIAQTVEVKLINCSTQEDLFWEITTKKNITVTNKDVQPEDTVYLSLNINTLFYLNTSIGKFSNTDSVVLELYIDDNKTLMILSGIGEGDFSFPFVTGSKNKQLKIVGGKDIDISSVPWQVYFEAGDYMCGGSILSESWVVTAAHCTEDDGGKDISATDMFIKVGATNPYRSTQGKKYSVKKVFKHENYNSRTIRNDIALLEIDGTIDFENAGIIEIITSEDVENRYTAPGVMAEISGWGLTGVDPEEYVDNLQIAKLPIISNSVVLPIWGLIPGTMIMAGYSDGRSDACRGDSGGPFVVETKDGKKLAGIVSWGSEDCDSYGAYTRVSSYETWIRDITGIEARYRPAQPIGSDIVCQGTVVSDYILDSVENVSEYEWELIPKEAAELVFSEKTARLNWDERFYGTVQLKTRVLIDDELSYWSILEIDRAENTAILGQSKDTVVCATQTVQLSVQGYGHNLAYRWFNNNNPAQSGISNYLRYTNSAVGNSGEIKCDVVGSCGTVESMPMDLIVYPITDISTIRNNVEVEYDNPFEIDISATGHNLTYQWYKDGEEILGENNSEYLIANSNAGDIGLYSAVVSGTCGIKYSDTVYVYSASETKIGFSANVWPTFTRDIINVAINSDQPYSIFIYSQHGKLIYQRIDNNYNSYVDVSKFVSGLYLVRIESEGDSKVFKIVLY